MAAGRPAPTLHAGLVRIGAHGVWCCLLLPLLLWSAYPEATEGDGSTDPYLRHVKDATFTLSCFLTLASLINAYHLVYGPAAAEEERGVLRYLSSRMVSDLFERQASKEVRVRRRRISQLPRIAVPPPPEFDRAKHSLLLSAGLFFVLLLLGKSFYTCLLALACLLMYFLRLPDLFRTFPLSFSFGEGCIVLQALALYVFESTLTLGADDLSTISGTSTNRRAVQG